MSGKEFIEKISSVVPGVTVVRKKDSRLMRFIGKLLFFNKNFMSSYTTTIGSTIYLSEGAFKSFEDKGPFSFVPSLLAHEVTHIYDSRKMGVLYPIAYLSPQIFSLFSFGALFSIWFSPWFLLFLLSLLLLLPIPSPGRMMIERRGYLMDLACSLWEVKQMPKYEIGNVVKHFSGSGYYFMWPFPEGLEKWFNLSLKEISEKKFPDELFSKIETLTREEVDVKDS